jgi:hypothetical protein
MQQQCAALNLPIKKQEPIIRKGWLHKPKAHDRNCNSDVFFKL